MEASSACPRQKMDKVLKTYTILFQMKEKQFISATMQRVIYVII